MLQPTDFLLQECKNVRALLRNTLRFGYSSESSGDIYRECLARIELIEFGFRVLHPDDTDELQELWVQLSRLSEIIGRVERSHIEEFSWPFAQSLQKLASSICSGAESSRAPLFFFSADDELSSYEVDTEQNAPGLLERPIFSVNFPRSLKPCVLLHAILGHEIGHAAFAIPKLSAQLRKEVVDVLIEGSPLSDLDRFEKWVHRTKSPLSIDFMFEKAHVSWPQELYCDLFGLLTMGPGYLGANCSLLLPFDMRSVSSSHPPGLTRYWMANLATESLGWHNLFTKHSTLGQPSNSYFGVLHDAAAKVPKKFQLLRAKQIPLAVDKLSSILRPMGNALFTMPNAIALAQMLRRLLAARPPIESKVAKDLSISNDQVDFRSILFAGWLAWHSKKLDKERLGFVDLNLLCERGVLLQSAIDYWESNKDKRSKRGVHRKQ